MILESVMTKMRLENENIFKNEEFSEPQDAANLHKIGDAMNFQLDGEKPAVPVAAEEEAKKLAGLSKSETGDKTVAVALAADKTVGETAAFAENPVLTAAVKMVAVVPAVPVVPGAAKDACKVAVSPRVQAMKNWEPAESAIFGDDTSQNDAQDAANLAEISDAIEMENFFQLDGEQFVLEATMGTGLFLNEGEPTWNFDTLGLVPSYHMMGGEICLRFWQPLGFAASEAEATALMESQSLRKEEAAPKDHDTRAAEVEDKPPPKPMRKLAIVDDAPWDAALTTCAALPRAASLSSENDRVQERCKMQFVTQACDDSKKNPATFFRVERRRATIQAGDPCNAARALSTTRSNVL